MRGPIALSVGIFVLMSALFWSCSNTGGVSVSMQEGPVFDHQGHVDRDLACSDCHGSEDEAWMAMPDLAFCNECHEDIDKEQPDKDLHASAFFDEEGKGRWRHAGAQADEVIFDHERHVTEDDEGCLDCHKAVAESTVQPGPADALMTMQACIDCHAADETASQYNDCASCHKELRKDRAPKSHRGAWMRTHGHHARMGAYDPLPSDCAMCHTRSGCQECHLALPPRSHTNHFRLRGHGALASMDRESCTTCHKTDTCEECHRNVAPRNHRGSWGGRFSRHCNSCHIPVGSPSDQGCAVCHRSTPSHSTAPPRPTNPAHMTSNSNACRECHSAPPPHPDNGQSCLICHQ